MNHDPDKPDSPPDSAREFLSEAYGLDDPERMKEFYAKWARDYDNQMNEGLGYASPGLIATRLITHQPDRHAPVLDVGCGTGLTVLDLAAAGYDALYGIDLSPEMIEVARGRGIYTGLVVGDLNQPLAYDDDFFGGVISSGTFTHGHVGPEPLEELVRVLAPGGVLACTVHDKLWKSRGFESAFSELESSGRLARLELTLDRYFDGGEPEGWFCIYRKA